MATSVVLFTRDLRLRDNSPLRAAQDTADAVVPLFVQDDAICAAGYAVPNRRAFLADCLADLDRQLRERGARLIVRTGDVVEQVCRVAHEADAHEVHMSADVSAYADRREKKLSSALAAAGRRLRVHDRMVTAVAPGEITPAGKDHMAVFTPYFRRWEKARQRPSHGAPARITAAKGVATEKLPSRRRIEGVSPGVPAGGETAGRKQFAGWRQKGMDAYADHHDDLAGDCTSRLSPHLHFGTLSPVELVARARERGGTGAEAFVRQLAWRDFHHQVLAARPQAARVDYRTHGDRWRSAREARDQIEAWKQGRTGYPVIDAAMRQLRHEGWMHNRGRLLAAGFLTKTLYVDWRIGARHFLDLLVDGDMANNQMNWQWVAGTGTDTRPNRILNPLVQAKKYDPAGDYVRRWVPELAAIEGRAVHEPWKLRGPHGKNHAAPDYPEPIVDLAAASERFRRARGK
ncbi:cryptochrome/photolyase family protein [Streptomyces spirodelae]|uniref:Deoxyribodipyrimidine photo-lyase n=1 Tax=Streptomyces spirodelae TaxID=2812904 RepID=A0ABS3WPK3_9ACTN|nr:deoxyribodipyrimidine photo-lyase [Streptomyces spirodelae]MBO8185052.1 deoxyribodipyrimidine photo-lyase [Streptomyces spirodelae]